MSARATSPPGHDNRDMAHRQRTRRSAVERAEVDSGTAELMADPDRSRAWTLLLDGTPQSHVDLDDPAYLDFEYIRRLGHVVDLAAPPGKPLQALHLGGGGLTLPRYIASTRPRSTQQVIEVDGALVDLVRRRLPLERTWRVRIRTGDAREVLARAPEDAFDLVISDVYAGSRIPAHLTSVEFVELAARVLRPGGFFAANVADGAPLAFARAQAATLRAVLPEVCLIADPAVLRGRRFGNLILVGGRVEPPVAALTRKAAGDPFPGRVVYGADLTNFIAGASPLTDATARPSPNPPPGIL
jgi:spermidine synthase